MGEKHERERREQGCWCSPWFEENDDGRLGSSGRSSQPGGTIREGWRGEMDGTSRAISRRKRCVIWGIKTPGINSTRNYNFRRDFGDQNWQSWGRCGGGFWCTRKEEVKG